jgi:hypothetical protein
VWQSSSSHVRGLDRWLLVARSAALACALWSAPLAAAEAASKEPLVVVMSSNPETPFVRRLAAELSLFGYRVEVVTRNTGDVDLGDLLEASGGAALIAVDPGKQTVDVVVAPQTSGGRARYERERLDPRRRADTNAAVLAERFRARLTELGIAPSSGMDLPEPVVAERSDAPAAPTGSPPVERRLWVSGAVGGTSGGVGFVPDAQIEIRAFPVPWLSTSAFAKLSPFAAEVSSGEARTDVRFLSGGVLIDAYPLQDEVVVKAGVGAMLVNTEMSGRASAPFRGTEDSVLVPAGLVDVGGAVRLSSRVSAELVGFVGVCAPRVGIRFAGRPVAHYGQPFFGASLGLAIGVF